MDPGDLLVGVMMVLLLPLTGDSASDPNDSAFRNGGRKLGDKNRDCCCCCCCDDEWGCAGLCPCDGVGVVGSPAMAPRSL